jgi:glycogen operon protein
MITAGDEMGRTQLGNNNAYCQDNEIGWVDWTADDDARALLDLHAPRCSRSAASTPAFAAGHFFRGRRRRPEGRLVAPADGTEMTPDDWNDGGNHVLGMLFTRMRRKSATSAGARPAATAS